MRLSSLKNVTGGVTSAQVKYGGRGVVHTTRQLRKICVDTLNHLDPDIPEYPGREIVGVGLNEILFSRVSQYFLFNS